MILDVFELLFKTNAKQTKKEVKELDEAIDESQKKINETNKVTEQLSNNLLKVGLQGLAAFTTFEGLKRGISDAVTFNATLEKTHFLTGANVTQLAAYDAAFAKFGSSTGEFLNWYKEQSKILQNAGMGSENIIPNLEDFADQIKKLNDEGNSGQALQLFRIIQSANGLPDSFYLSMLQGSQGIEKVAEEMRKMQAISSETTEAGRELEAQWKNVGIETQSLFTGLLPTLKAVLFFLQEIVKAFTATGLVIQGAFQGAYGLATGDWSGWNRSSRHLQDLMSRAGKSSIPVKESSASPSLSGSPQEQSRAFWKSQGYTDAQIAGLLATEQHESNFNPRAVGDGGRARGLFQWHPDRRRGIFAGTGIDIDSASREDQLRAAAWELEQRGDADRLRRTSTPAQAADVLTRYFERPADIEGQSYMRGLTAGKHFLSFADNSPINSTPSQSAPVNYTIGDITIHTQATDADGVSRSVRESLQEQLTYLASNSNDGIAR